MPSASSVMTRIWLCVALPEQDRRAERAGRRIDALQSLLVRADPDLARRSVWTANALSSAIALFFGVYGVKRPFCGSKRLTPPAHVAIQILPDRSSASDSTASEFRLLVAVV